MQCTNAHERGWTLKTPHVNPAKEVRSIFRPSQSQHQLHERAVNTSPSASIISTRRGQFENLAKGLEIYPRKTLRGNEVPASPSWGIAKKTRDNELAPCSPLVAEAIRGSGCEALNKAPRSRGAFAMITMRTIVNSSTTDKKHDKTDRSRSLDKPAPQTKETNHQAVSLQRPSRVLRTRRGPVRMPSPVAREPCPRLAQGGRGQSLKHRMRVNPIPFCRNLCHKHTWISQGSSSCAAFLSPRFSFMRRFLALPAGQRWQNLQLLPLEQPAPPWKKLHGRHSPRACPFEPTFQNKSAMSTYAGMSVEDSMPAMLAGCSGPSGSATRAGCSAALGSPHQEPSASGKLGSESTGASFSELDALLSAEVSESGAVESALETSTSRRGNTEMNAVQWMISLKPTVARNIHYGCVCVYIYIYVCMYVCMDGWMDGWMDGCMCVCILDI